MTDRNSNGNVIIQGFAKTNSFYGYMKFTGPNGLVKIAGPMTFYGNNLESYAYIVESTNGKYCVTGYFPDGSNYQGTACNNIY